MANKLLNFRCPPGLLETLDVLGVQRYPSENDNGYDRTKTLLDVIEAGIQALQDGSVEIPISKTECKTDSKTNINQEELKGELRAELVPEFNEMLSSLRDEFEDRLGKLQSLRDNADSPRPAEPVPDYKQLKEQYLKSLKLGNKAPDYRRAMKHLNQFIKLIQDNSKRYG